MRVPPSHHHPHHTPAASHAKPGQHPAAAAKSTASGWQANGGAKLGGGEPSIDLNGTPYTRIEGRAASSNISIRNKRPFDPLTERGIALTASQAKKLGVKVGDTVTVRDSLTGASVTATYYDGAGTKPDGLKHFEVNPALADALGLSYRNSKGKVVDAIAHSDRFVGRFSIEK